MPTFKQASFIGGMNLLVDETEIPENAYRWMINGRQRLGTPQPIKSHVLQSDLPAGLKQGVVSLGNILIAFVAGSAYYRVEGTEGWLQVSGFSMSTTAARYWSLAVPSSKFNLERRANEDGNARSALNVPVNTKVAGTPAGVLVQDGLNQPQLIQLNATAQSQFLYARVTNNYSQWNNDGTAANSREYVPIGKFMMMQSDILFIVAPDGHSVYRSVSGRPLDFMVNVDTAGKKLSSETVGGAASVSFAFDYDVVTALYPVNIPNAFLYGTQSQVRVVAMNFDRTIFGEPLFDVSAKIDAGVVNEDSVLELLGDIGFVDYENVKTFNAVRQLYVEGDNSIFSLQLSSLVDEIRQSTPRVVSWDNYALFDIDTRWGRLMAVFDTLLDVWVSLDITDLGEVKQFASVITEGTKSLYAINTANELYKLFSGERATAQIMTRAWADDDVEAEIKLETIRCIFDAGQVDGTLRVREYMNNQMTQEGERELNGKVSGVLYPVIPPVIPHTLQLTNNESLTFDQGRCGTKVQLHIQWDNDAKLHEVQIKAASATAQAAIEQQNKVLSGTQL